jgi:hypothetical protein
MITLTREEAQQVLGALKKIIQGCDDVERDERIHKDGKDVAKLVRIDCREPAETLRTRLAQPEPEPVAFINKFGQVFNPAEGQCYIRWKMRDKLSAEEVPMPLYTAPPQREWQGLTDEEIGAVIADCNITLLNYCSEDKQTEYARAIEAKLKEKNG